MTENPQEDLKRVTVDYSIQIVRATSEVVKVTVTAFETIFDAIENAVKNILENPKFQGRKIEQIDTSEFKEDVQSVTRILVEKVLANASPEGNGKVVEQTRVHLTQLFITALIASEISTQQENAKNTSKEIVQEKNEIDYEVFKVLKKKLGMRVRIATLRRRLEEAGIVKDEHLVDIMKRINILEETSPDSKKALKIRFNEEYGWIQREYQYPKYGLTKDQLSLITAYLETKEQEEA